ncbi:MAG: hypothetical protein WDM89_22120 [Rhizomicrobium sp.]
MATSSSYDALQKSLMVLDQRQPCAPPSKYMTAAGATLLTLTKGNGYKGVTMFAAYAY